MRVLAIDTSHNEGSVALVEAAPSPFAAQLLAAASARVSNAHGEALLPLVDAVLRSAGLTLDAVELLAVGIGPGSFTGTRIGVATAKGLAIGRGLPLRGVASFEALALDARTLVGAEVAVAIDARKGEVYLAVMTTTEDDVVRLTDPIHARPAEAWARVGRPVPSASIGDGVSLVPELALAARRHVGVDAPRAAAIAALAGARQLRAPIDEVDVLEPLYVRPPDITLPKTKPGMPGVRGPSSR
ncbi:MAG: tRNA (adenosine(37)-N6)-threonylcarbamoyltransferase complex dimerization subunit type 1 TsaB [Polyangiales bacterium]